MPGLGGRAAAAAHVAGSARVIRAVAPAAPAGDPLVVRLRTAAVVPSTPLGARAAAGEFVLPDDVEVAQELRDLLEQLGDARLELRSDHMLNLLHELEGSLPRDRGRLIALLDEYLGLAARRSGALCDRGAARPLPAPRRLRRPGAPPRPRAAVHRLRGAERRRAAGGRIGAALALHLTRLPDLPAGPPSGAFRSPVR